MLFRDVEPDAAGAAGYESRLAFEFRRAGHRHLLARAGCCEKLSPGNRSAEAAFSCGEACGVRPANPVEGCGDFET